MEATIKIENRKVYTSLVQFLKTIGISVLSVKNTIQNPKKFSSKKFKMDPVSLISEKSLGEEWDSEEDKRWDKPL